MRLSLLRVILGFSFLSASCLAQQHTPGQAPPCMNPTNRECPPYPPPTCNVIDNNDWTIPFQQPNLAAEILPTIQTHYRKHSTNYPTYTFPLTFLWDSLGISSLMDDPKPKLDCCHQNIVFTRDQRSPTVAVFDWTGTAETVDSKPLPQLQGWKLQLKIPAHLTGWTTITAGFTEFRFNSVEVPHITITEPGGTVVYNDDISCTKGSNTSVVVKPREPSGTQKNPDLVIRP